MPFVKRHRAGDQMPKVVSPAPAGIGQTLDWGSCLETSEPPLRERGDMRDQIRHHGKPDRPAPVWVLTFPFLYSVVR